MYEDNGGDGLSQPLLHDFGDDSGYPEDYGKGPRQRRDGPCSRDVSPSPARTASRIQRPFVCPRVRYAPWCAAAGDHVGVRDDRY